MLHLLLRIIFVLKVSGVGHELMISLPHHGKILDEFQ